jgi:hypothetical protein
MMKIRFGCISICCLRRICRRADETPATNKTIKRLPPKLRRAFAARRYGEAAQCVRLETDAGAIELEMFPESAPETVRAFLNLAAGGFLDTTTFSRVVPGFMCSGRQSRNARKRTAETDKRSYLTVRTS